MFLLPPESSTLGKSDFLIFPNKIRTKWHLFLVLILIPVVTNEVFPHMSIDCLCSLENTCLCVLPVFRWIVCPLFFKIFYVKQKLQIKLRPS